MIPKKTSVRTCVVTKEKYPKHELIRIVRTPSGEIVIDQTGKLNGRGAYLRLTSEVIEQARNKKSLNYHLKLEVPNSIYEELTKLIKE